MKNVVKLLGTLALCAIVITGCKDKREVLDVTGDCEISALSLDSIDGVIDARAKSIVVTVANDYDCSKMIVTRLQISEGATCDVAVGDLLNMISARTLRVVHGDAMQQWALRVEKVREKIEKPKAIYIGLAEDYSRLNIEEQTACLWMMENIEKSTYASFAEVSNGDVNLSECKLIWWHFHKDGGVDGKNDFETSAPVVKNAAARLIDYYKKGGAFLLTRYATYLPYYLGEAECFPNNCWGGVEKDAEVVSSPWSFFATNHTDHPLFTDLVMDDEDPTRIYTCDAGYSITNSTAQWKLAVDWSVYPDEAAWRTATGAKDLAYGDQAIVVWEFEATAEHGTILCIGSGCYDWYSKTGSSEHYHRNVASMTLNAFNYLMK